MKFIFGLNVTSKFKENILVYSLAIYLLFYTLCEWTYIKFLYQSPMLYSINKKNPSYLETFFAFIKHDIKIILALIFLKIILIFMLLPSKTRRISALALSVVLVVLLLLNQSSSPELKYLNLLLVMLSLFKVGSVFTPKTDIIKNAIWFSFGMGYSISGYYKLITPLWYNGNFLNKFVTENQNFNQTFDFLANFPIVLQTGTHFTLIAELLALPLCFFKRTRLLSLVALSLMQLGLLIVADVNQITFGVLIFHLFMFFVAFENKDNKDNKGEI